jgi:hypothetical protein
LQREKADEYAKRSGKDAVQGPQESSEFPAKRSAANANARGRTPAERRGNPKHQRENQ